MSVTNGQPSATMSDQLNESTNNNPDENNLAQVMNLVDNLQTLVPDIKKNVIVISQQFTQFISCVEQLNQLSSNTRSIQLEHARLERELEQMKKDREEIEQRCQNNADDRVYLDVGGQRFTTTVKTLTQGRTSLFFKMLVNEHRKRDVDAAANPIFIDRDGRLFDYILKYLRTGELNVDDKITRKELLTEAKYFKLRSLEEQLQATPKKELSAFSEPFETIAFRHLPLVHQTIGLPGRSSLYMPNLLQAGTPRLLAPAVPKVAKTRSHPSTTASSWRASPVPDIPLNVFVGSYILTAEYEEKLIEFLGIAPDQPYRPWRLIYRATEHGQDAADFHRYCDSVAPTISIIESDYGNIFGGFTSVAWSSAQLRADQADETAFLFTLKNAVNVPPTKFPIDPAFQQRAISHNPTCGPNFGSPKNEGSDLCLRNKFNEKSNCVFFPKSYLDPTNQGAIVFAKRHFACKQVEVFTLDWSIT